MEGMIEKTEASPEVAEVIKLSEWAVDKLVTNTSSYLQTVMRADNITPTQLEYLYRTKLHILKTYSAIHNISLLYNSDGTPKLNYACYDVRHYLTVTVKQISDMFANYGIDIKILCPDECKNAILDIRRIGLILFNLISNSIIHTNVKEKHIVISVRNVGENLVISVRDNGQGIDRDYRPRIFTAYKSSLMLNEFEKTGGGLLMNGLGLSVAKKSAEDMGGSLDHIPTKKGCLFEISIPQKINGFAVYENVLYEPDREEVELYLAGALLKISENDTGNSEEKKESNI